jgi:deazaflavin-dependent oxidoreductase (nitroreductase family)
MTEIVSEDLPAKLERVAAHERRIHDTPMTRVFRRVGPTRAFAEIYPHIGPHIDPWLARMTRGLQSRVYGIPGLVLTTTGARTGRRRRCSLIYVRDGRDFAVVGSNFGRPGHPAWSANLLARPEASIDVGPEQLAVTAELADDETRERLWPRFLEMYPGFGAYGTRSAPRVPRMFLLHPTG